MSKAARVKRRQARNLTIGPEKKIVSTGESTSFPYMVEILECGHEHAIMQQTGLRPAKYRRCEKCKV